MERLLELAGVPVSSVWSGESGSRVHHLEAGHGPAVVLIHGGVGGGANWFRMFALLSNDFRVLAPDLPGFGLSDRVRPTGALSEVAASFLEEWLRVHELRDVLVAGTSFGGLAALRLAQRSGRVSRLLLLDSAGLGRAIHPAVRLVTATPLGAVLLAPTRRGTALTFRRLLTTDRSELTPEHQSRLIDYLYQSGRAAGTRYLTRTLRAFAGARGQREVVSRDELMSLTLPVSIVWGELDRFLPVAQARAAAQWVPHAALEVIPGTGHSPNWERPAEVARAIRELARRQVRGLPDRRAH